MKKKIITVAAAAIAAFTAFALVGCSDDAVKSGEVKANGNVSLTVAFTAKTAVTDITATTSLKDYMDALAKNNEIVFDGQDGAYGYFVESFFGLKAYTVSSTATAAEGWAWSLYVDFTTLDGDDAQYASDYQTYNYNGTTLYSANYGVSGIPCVAGHTYAFVYEYYNYSW